MPALADIVRLGNGSVGVISEAVPLDYWRVLFPDGTRRDVLAADVAETLAAASYAPGDAVTVWPDLGAIETISGDTVSVRLEKSERIEGVRHIRWSPIVTVPMWRIALDNDGRLGRAW